MKPASIHQVRLGSNGGSRKTLQVPNASYKIWGNEDAQTKQNNTIT